VFINEDITLVLHVTLPNWVSHFISSSNFKLPFLCESRGPKDQYKPHKVEGGGGVLESLLKILEVKILIRML
jgi:hypothetical protein